MKKRLQQINLLSMMSMDTRTDWVDALFMNSLCIKCCQLGSSYMIIQCCFVRCDGNQLKWYNKKLVENWKTPWNTSSWRFWQHLPGQSSCLSSHNFASQCNWQLLRGNTLFKNVLKHIDLLSTFGGFVYNTILRSQKSIKSWHWACEAFVWHWNRAESMHFSTTNSALFAYLKARYWHCIWIIFSLV